MKIGKTQLALAGMLAFSTALVSSSEWIPYEENLPAIGIGVTQAEAAPRNVARRTGRRTSRRVSRRTSIAGCSPYNAYYNCGGVYYRPVVESGTTVYVVVNP
jgi:hypothetical protein